MRVIHLAAGAAAIALIFCAGASQAQSASPTGVVAVGMICNTPEQARQYLDLRAGGAVSEDAMRRVNETADNPNACGVAAIAFVPDKMLRCHFVEDKLMEIVRINVLAGFDGTGWQNLPSLVQYAVMEGKGDAI